MQQYSEIIQKARSRKKELRKFCNGLKTKKSGFVDQLFHEAHEKAFDEIDCLACANCCKTTGPLFTSKDVERIAAYLKLKPGEFAEKYLRIDEDEDYVLKQVPCAFLLNDNRCSIYEVRPKACREYPHTDRRDMQGIIDLTYKNAFVCPAVARIFEMIERRVNSK
ncbi:MAG: YkgJ family cysteine cluster protein [Flavobacteriales bacterium]|nr:YkgJ family cysteine cluster protein [Flavobacteriales bacterium]